MPHKDPVKRKEYFEQYRAANREKNKEYSNKYREDRKQNAIDSIISYTIIDRHKWDMWCDEIKRNAKNKHPYSDDFTNDIMFTMMIQGCFYCGQLATTVDRIDSALDHTPNNCVASCYGCNFSKGVSDPSTFIRKAYYRARGEYADDVTNIWFVHETKPDMSGYRIRAKKQGVPFELKKKDWEILTKGVCVYCKRSPTTWFGVDRVNPSKGYIIDNVISCCFDCNVDKHKFSVDTMSDRNVRISDRVDTGELDVNVCDEVILNCGIKKSSKKVCVYGNVYKSARKASRAIECSNNYICQCVDKDWQTDDIFEITEEFYDFAIDNKLENITRRMYVLFDRM